MTLIYKGTSTQQAIAQQAVAACDYPWSRLTRNVTISWRSLAAEGAYGLYWPGKYLVEVDTGIESQPVMAQQVTIAELWHAVDDQAVTDAQRQAIAAAYHSTPDQHQWYTADDNQYTSWLGEAMMFGFSGAFAPSLGISGLERQFVHRVTPQVAAQVRTILLGDAPTPPPPPPPPPGSGHAAADDLFAQQAQAWLNRHPYFYRSLQRDLRAWLASR